MLFTSLIPSLTTPPLQALAARYIRPKLKPYFRNLLFKTAASMHEEEEEDQHLQHKLNRDEGLALATRL